MAFWHPTDSVQATGHLEVVESFPDTTVGKVNKTELSGVGKCCDLYIGPAALACLEIRWTPIPRGPNRVSFCSDRNYRTG